MAEIMSSNFKFELISNFKFRKVGFQGIPFRQACKFEINEIMSSNNCYCYRNEHQQTNGGCGLCQEKFYQDSMKPLKSIITKRFFIAMEK